MLLSVTAAALLAAGCGDWRDQEAARVGDQTVSMSELREEVSAISARPDLATALQVDTLQAAGTEADQSTTTLVSWLNRRISDLVIDEELARRGISVDEADVARAEQDLRFQLEVLQQEADMGPQPSALVNAFDQLPEEMRRAMIEREAARTALGEALAEEAGTPVAPTAEAWYQAHREDYRRVCASVVQTADRAAAEAARSRIEAGTPFATVAAEVSLAPNAAQGGDAGCALLAELSPELTEVFEDAGQGRLAGPVEAGGGWVLFQVDELGAAPFDDPQVAMRVGIDRLSARQDALRAWITDASPSIEVTPRLGTWDPAQVRVVPNPGPVPAGEA